MTRNASTVFPSFELAFSFFPKLHHLLSLQDTGSKALAISEVEQEVRKYRYYESHRTKNFKLGVCFITMTATYHRRLCEAGSEVY